MQHGLWGVPCTVLVSSARDVAVAVMCDAAVELAVSGCETPCWFFFFACTPCPTPSNCLTLHIAHLLQAGHGETASVSVTIAAGSRNESAKNNGTAHFVEHLNFKVLWCGVVVGLPAICVSAWTHIGESVPPQWGVSRV